MFRGFFQRHKAMTETKQYESEKSELNLLIEKGVQFEVEREKYVRQEGFFGRFKKLIKVTETLKFTINEPTLSVLDRIASEQIELKIDEKVMSSEAGLQEAKKMAITHGRRLARILAICALGQNYRKTIQQGSQLIYSKDDERLDELTDLFFNHIKPSKLLQLVLLVNTISNLGDFTNSIRLMSAARTTMPIRIEDEQKD